MHDFFLPIRDVLLDILSRASEVEGDGKPTVEVLQLEKQNERLKEALVRYVSFKFCCMLIIYMLNINP
jgi:hypothetical protein